MTTSMMGNISLAPQMLGMVPMVIEQSGRGCWLNLRQENVKQALQDDRYANAELPYDRASFQRAGVVFALDEASSDGVNLCRKPAPTRY